MSRPAELRPPVTSQTVRLGADHVATLDRLAARWGLSRAGAVRRLLELAADGRLA